MSILNGTISGASAVSQTASGVPGASPLLTQQTPRWTLPNPPGTAGTADNADRKYSKTLTLSATPTVIDLTSFPDIFGNTTSMARVRRVYILNKSTTDGQVVLLGYATTTTNAWTGLVTNPGQLTVSPSSAANSGWFEYVAPNTTGLVVTSSNKLLQLDPVANTIICDVEIIGCSV